MYPTGVPNIPLSLWAFSCRFQNLLSSVSIFFLKCRHIFLTWRLLERCGSYSDNSGCTLCPLGTFQPSPGKSKCISCPARMWTVSTGSSSFRACVGPTLRICDGANFTGTCKKFHDRVDMLPFKIKSLQVLAGTWLFYKDEAKKYFLNMWRFPYENTNVGSGWRDHFSSFEADSQNTFCYVGNGERFDSDDSADLVYDVTDDGRFSCSQSFQNFCISPC